MLASDLTQCGYLHVKNSIPHLYYDILIRLRYHIFDELSTEKHYLEHAPADRGLEW